MFATLDRHHFAWLSIATALLTIFLKTLAWWLTGSVGLLSDAAESLVNLAGASFALWMILISRVPADEEHPFGHGKAEYFSSGFEGLLIFIAALAIMYTAVQRLITPQPLQTLGIGLAVSMLSTAINYAVSLILKNAGARLNSIALCADSRHLMTDVWTSIGILVGLAVVALSGWLWLDAAVAIAVSVHIMVEGYRLIRASADGMMDSALDEASIEKVQAVLGEFAQREVQYKELKTRRAGTEAFIQLSVLVPGDWTVARAHELLDEIEARLGSVIPGAAVITHLEPIPEQLPKPLEI